MICDKIGHDTYKAATTQVVGLNKRTHHKYRIYKCSFCSLFHIATIKPGQRTFIKKEKYKKIIIVTAHPEIKQQNLNPVGRAQPLKSFITMFKPFKK